MSTLKERGQEYLRSIAMLHMPSNARRYTWKVIMLDFGTTMMGFNVDHSPFEGKVVAFNDEFVVIKTGRSEFRLLDRSLIKDDSIPDIGNTIKVTPYHRREFDGTNLGAPKETRHADGFTTTSFALGKDTSELPINKADLKSEYLKDMIKQVEHIKMPDGMRTIAQAMIDYGAMADEVRFVDPTDDDIIKTPPALIFNVNTTKFFGELEIAYDRAMDAYDIKISSVNTTEVKECLFFDDLGTTIADLIDDGKWKFAKIETLKAVKLKKAA